MSPVLLRSAIVAALLLLAVWLLPRWQSELDSWNVLLWAGLGLCMGEPLRRVLNARKAKAAAIDSREERRQDLEQTAWELSEGEPQG